MKMRNNGRICRIEELESREMLSVSMGDFDVIKSQYEDLNLTHYSDYNIIEITADELSAKTLQTAVNFAAQTTQDDLIVVRNNGARIVDLGTETLNVNINSDLYGSLTIVILEPGILQIQSSANTGVVQVVNGNIAIGGVILCGIDNGSGGGISVYNLIQTGAHATVQTSRVIKVTETTNPVGNYTIFSDASSSSSLLSGAGGTLIGTKSYSLIFGVGGTLEAYLTGLSEYEKNSIVFGSMGFLNNLSPYDAEKTGFGDTNHCWAGTAANMLAYTGWGNINGFQTEDDIFTYFRSNFTDLQSNAWDANQWFIIGDYYHRGWSDWAQPKSTSSGGFYPSVNYDTFAGYNDINDASGITGAINRLKAGSAIALTLGWYNTPGVRNGGYFITMWGAVYNTAKSPTANDYYVSLLITDPDDNYGQGVNAPNLLKSLSITYSTAYGKYNFGSSYYAGTGYLESYTWLVSQASTLPATPTSFRSTARTPDSVTFEWDAQSNLTSYTLEYKKSTESTWTTWTPAPGITATSATITGLTPYTAYNFQLTATNASGSATSATNATTQSTDTDLPTAPVNFRSTTQTTNSLMLEWDSQSSLTGYTLMYRASGATAWSMFTPDPVATATSVTMTGLTAGMDYEFRLRAINTVGSQASEIIASTKSLPAPAPVKPKVKVEAKKATTNSITLTLSAPNKNSTLGSNVEYIITCTSHPDIIVPLATGTRVVIEGLQPSKTYKFTVTAVNADGKAVGINGEATTVKVTAKTPKYTAPKKGSVTDRGLGTATIGLKGASKVVQASDTVKNGFKAYEVGVLVGGVWFFSEKADAYWVGQGIAVDYNGTVDGKAVITGLGGQKYTFGIREVAYTGTTESDKGVVFAVSAIAKFSVQPTKYAAVKNNGSTGTQLQWKANDAMVKPADTEGVTYQKSYEVGIYKGTAVVFPGDATWEAVFGNSPYTSIEIGNDCTFTTEDLSITLTGVSAKKVSFAVREVITKTEGGMNTVVAKSAITKITVKG